MIPWKRPPKPPRFEQDAAELLLRLRTLVEENGGVPKSKHFEGSELWHQNWRDRGYKATLSGHTHGRIEKCAWCERDRDLRELDIDHFRPKTAVHEWAASPPDQAQYDKVPPSLGKGDPGYWWRAFEWENWTLACKTCNSGWKRTLFPVEDGVRQVPNNPNVGEVHLLLHPYEPFEPEDHFTWDPNSGVISGITVTAQWTIAVLGLNRDELVSARLALAQDVKLVLDRLLEAMRAKQIERIRHEATAIQRMGCRRRPFTGMVRWMTQQWLGLKWGSVSWLPDDDSPDEEDETG